MKFFLIIAILLSIYSCGKSPLQLKKSDEITSIDDLQTGKFFTTTNQSLNINWLSPINSTDEGHALLIVKKNGVATDLPSSFNIFLWMPDMGHGSSPIKITKLTTGVYDLSAIYFIMDGDWQLRIQLKNGSTILEEQKFEYTL